MDVVPEIKFSGIDNPETQSMLTIVDGSSDQHTLLYEDRIKNSNRIVYLSSLEDNNNFQNFLIFYWKNLPLSFRSRARANVLNDGLDLNLMGVDLICGEVISFIGHHFLLMQYQRTQYKAPYEPERPKIFGPYTLF
jgi:hypothetical protein